VLTKVSGNGRCRKDSANEVLAHLDAFAALAGRRGARSGTLPRLVTGRDVRHQACESHYRARPAS